MCCFGANKTKMVHNFVKNSTKMKQYFSNPSNMVYNGA